LLTIFSVFKNADICSNLPAKPIFPIKKQPYNTDEFIKCFLTEYNVPLITIAEHTDLKLEIDHWHPLKYGQIFSSNFSGISNIKPNDRKKVKITFNSKVSANEFLTSPLLQTIGFTAYIPSTLIYSYGVIRVATSFSKENFWDDINKEVQVIEFKRISTRKEGILTPTSVIELKFLFAKIPDSLSIYNVIFKIFPNVRSPLQYNNCFRFRHTAKFCRSKARCSHCGENNHSLNVCPSVNEKEPCCIFCKLPHLATDRNCHEWEFQRDVKKIMATENIPFREVIYIKEKPLYQHI